MRIIFSSLYLKKYFNHFLDWYVYDLPKGSVDIMILDYKKMTLVNFKGSKFRYVMYNLSHRTSGT